MEEFLNYTFSFGKYQIAVIDLLLILAILVFAKIAIWIVNRIILTGYFKRKNLDVGRQFAVRQIVMYLIWAFTVFAILEMLGVATAVMAGLAAFLVGIGLGLQDVFKDLASGIIILIEGTANVGDMIEIDGQPAVVREIGLRTSVVETRDQVSILIPNSRLVVDAVINWSHNRNIRRFNVSVGVAYGSDVEKVTELLLQAAAEHPKVLENPAPVVFFEDFGNSSLDFNIYFYSRELFGIPRVRSEIRYSINKLFKEHNIEIPFPQRDLWIRNAVQLDK
ncbi:MAG: potassium transporter KefA [Bacteroidetes bacterium]|nr:MAG: potassium transporter KefA [Bacteroidota bacterium]